MNTSKVLYHPYGYCPDCGLGTINEEIVADPDDSMILPSHKVSCSKCGQDLEVTEIKRVEHEEYDQY